ncbi:CbtA family protein [soil metagenome]
MNARAFLIRGLLAGLLAGLVTFAVAYVVGEPPVDQAIAVEEAGEAPAALADDHHTHGEEAVAGHSHGEDAAVSRQDQSTWGLLTGTVTIAVTVGGILALVAAGAMGRMGPLSPAVSTTLVGALGYVSVAVVPFLKYPATPPAVGDGQTIGQRTVLYFVFLLISVTAVAACALLAGKLSTFIGVHNATLVGAGSYLVTVVLAALLMPTVNEVGDFPADVLWDFRIASLLTLTTLWATVTIALSVLISRLHGQHKAVQARREFAASL